MVNLLIVIFPSGWGGGCVGWDLWLQLPMLFRSSYLDGFPVNTIFTQVTILGNYICYLKELDRIKSRYTLNIFNTIKWLVVIMYQWFECVKIIEGKSLAIFSKVFSLVLYLWSKIEIKNGVKYPVFLTKRMDWALVSYSKIVCCNMLYHFRNLYICVSYSFTAWSLY